MTFREVLKITWAETRQHKLQLRFQEFVPCEGCQTPLVKCRCGGGG